MLPRRLYKSIFDENSCFSDYRPTHCPHPIVQGGMGIHVSGAGLAAALANAGGIGVISAVGLGMHSPYFDIEEKNPKTRQTRFFKANRLALIDELQKARALDRACRGDVENGLVLAGSSVGGSSHIQPVAEVMAELVGA